MKTLYLALGLFAASTLQAQTISEGDFKIRNFKLADGEQIETLNLHYRTCGKPVTDKNGKTTNAVLIMHGTGGTGGQFIRKEFSDVLFVKGGVLDCEKYFVILPDGIGHGKSSKPSDGLRAGFPKYGYRDMVKAQYKLVTKGLKVNHLRLVMGTSMGGMHTWLWGQAYPDFMDALMPLASLPTQISGRNRVWRRTIMDAIRNDPAWEGGNYTKQPPSLRTAQEITFFMGSNPTLRQEQMPDRATADKVLDEAMDKVVANTDANDVLYQISASSDYDPGPGLEKIKAPLLAVNSDDDIINPPELRIIEREIQRVPNAKLIMIPLSPASRGHGSHTIADLWKDDLKKLLDEAPPR